MPHELNPAKLHVTFQENIAARELSFPRRYTLTHSDTTGDLFLTIGRDYDHKQISGLYTRLMRDEVLAELVNEQGVISLHIYVHVSGGIILGTAGWRNDILHHHMPMVLEAFRYGDRDLYSGHPALDEARIEVHFSAKQAQFNKVESWGQVKKFI